MGIINNPPSGSVVTTTATGTQNDFAPSGLFFQPGVVSTLRCNNATLLTINGIVGGVDGAFLEIESVGAGQVDLAHQAAGSTAGNRQINFATSGPSSAAPGVGTFLYRYDGTASRWRLISHEQGAWITPAFSAGNFGANGSMTWTVSAGSVVTDAYYLRGRTLFWTMLLASTTVGGTANTQLKLTVPAGFTIAHEVASPLRYVDNGTAGIGFYDASPPGGSVVLLFKTDVTAIWSLSTAATNMAVSMVFDVA